MLCEERISGVESLMMWEISKTLRWVAAIQNVQRALFQKPKWRTLKVCLLVQVK